jgi:hypothetical protein
MYLSVEVNSKRKGEAALERVKACLMRLLPILVNQKQIRKIRGAR